MQKRAYLLSLLTTALLAFAAFQGAQRYFGNEEREAAAGRLSLYQSTVTAELERFQHLTYVLSLDPFVIAAADGAPVAALNTRLEEFADQAGIDAIYLMDESGLTIAASNHGRPASFLGQNYGFRPYFRSALNGAQGRFYAIGATTGRPGYFIADPVQGRDGIAGVIALKIDLSQLEDSWRNSGEQVLLANADGVVLLASNPAWQYRTLSPLGDDQQARIDEARQFTGQVLDQLDWTPLADGRARIAGTERIHLTSTVPPHDWVLHYFASPAPAVTRSWLAAAFVIVAAGLALIAYQVQRARRVGAALARSEREEAELRQANERLAQEIEDRRTAERRLKRTQGELERASRLAALGQLAASVTHELGQPIAAMKNHLTAAELSGPAPAGGLIGKIGSLVQRMEDTARQLKFFARSDAEAFEDVDLSEAMRAALTLVEPNREACGAVIDTSFPDRPALIRGSRLRIEQVMTNLLRNALDAAEGQAQARLKVTVGAGEADSWFSVRDNGHGLGAATLAELQEPFVTTRESGRGMGLGLAIAAGIVQDHAGAMMAENIETGGACFTVRFPASEPDASEAA